MEKENHTTRKKSRLLTDPATPTTNSDTATHRTSTHSVNGDRKVYNGVLILRQATPRGEHIAHRSLPGES